MTSVKHVTITDNIILSWISTVSFFIIDMIKNAMKNSMVLMTILKSMIIYFFIMVFF